MVSLSLVHASSYSKMIIEILIVRPFCNSFDIKTENKIKGKLYYLLFSDSEPLRYLPNAIIFNKQALIFKETINVHSCNH